MYMYKCLECECEFDDRSLHCEDWRNEDLRLGCPNCKTFYKLKRESTSWPFNLKIIIFVSSMMGLFNAIGHSDASSALPFGVIFLSSSVLFYKYLPLMEKYAPIVKVASHNKSIQPTAKASTD
jgi:hypothetical protein